MTNRMARGARQRNEVAGASARERGSALLIGALALILQLFLSPLHTPFQHASLDSPQEAARLGALVNLAALTGDPNVICAEADDRQPGDPTHDNGDCPGLCCHLGHGLAFFLAPPAFSPAVPLRVAIGFVGSRPISFVTSAHAPNAQPRGPPPSA
ncbi:MAG: hypothetical protein JOZ30_16035 [Hyphomicrobiales bacterium]|nr:hypothetical protein [Hyphomicrobiales bacterium]MBV8764110.1 hypothetical protein [Hyphomicrobiales bacterium]MBV9741147.1 hypothetical protein [Hyphomicrobiales bacterium]